MATLELDGTVLITGASGFIGSRLKDALLASGSDVVAVRRVGSPEQTAGRSVTADYADVEGLTAIVAEERPDYVLHVAGVTKGRTYEDFQRGNVMPTRNLLKALQAGHPTIKRFVHVSSLTAYGPSAPGAPLRETDPAKPIEFYGRSKLEAEQVVAEESAGIAWTILRPAGVYGPGDVDYFNLFQSAMRGWNAYFGNRNRLMSLVYVDDCVRAIIEGGKHPNTTEKGYFIAEEEPVTWQRFQDEIVDIIPRKVRTLDLPEGLVSMSAFAGELATRFDGKPRLLNRQKAKMGAQEAWTCSVDAAKTDFGFETQTGLHEGIQLTHDWYTEHGWY
ncbi:MAG: NAD(P)-dependent oxidoreductase [Deltaproteobacteria bacterium]|nr:NAD(P)-dependent oxidoreductase [Deltaproteobacteria bacterium]MBW1875918.1 NAD(P)-dependent oxidoreductase [Deltaproteobacteria bacterium]MBW2552060.1 NAD(P)-dependent oxidoreductase [Deltaproteobacteria bacterium]MBW2627881.1 NAD(P)-dependent oxidoreductase [Deltaproteobacteria bacterium]MBW2686167.1 NAD(P)-dependent oxidoreductase [Deltaproteobacteria bacterium]